MGLQKHSRKQQQWYRELVPRVIQLVQQNDHDSLALIARNCGIPPQLRHIVWPILLKYHPFVIAPSILSNTLIHDKAEDRWIYEVEERTEEEVSELIQEDLYKYFLNKRREATLQPLPDIEHHLQFLKKSILRFLAKWSRIFKYEVALTWIAIALAEWVPIDDEGEDVTCGDGVAMNQMPIGKNRSQEVNVLQGKRHHITVQSLYKEYPLPQELSTRLPQRCFGFYEIYERLVLVILHCPDMMQSRMNADYEQNLPVISGGDVLFRTHLFFKIFQTVLPELYQPFVEEETLQSSRKVDWLYWWFKSCGCKVMHKQDRAHMWDILLGWRPRPSNMQFYLSYKNKTFEHIYKRKLKLDQQFLNKVCKDGNDPFWFPDLDSLNLGSVGLETDFQVMGELIRRNKYENEGSHSSSSTSIPDQCSFDDASSGKVRSCKQREIPFSLIDPHVQLLFIFIAILQQNEFKLLEFEETEISEFLMKMPLLSKVDDYNYKRLYDDDAISMSSTDTEDSQHSSSRPSTSSHMLIEVGTDDKVSYSFDDICQLAGDIWRKWMWLEFEEHHDSV